MITINIVNRFFTILIFCLLSCFIAEGQSNVRFPLTDPQYGISQTTNATVTVQAENISQSGTVTLLPLTLQQVTDVTGLTTFSNLYGSSISGFYHWTVAIYNSSKRATGDMWVQSTNMGTVNEGFIDIVNGAPSYPAGTWCWSAQASDLRYAASVYSLTNYTTLSQLLFTSNSIVSLIPNTNGFVSGTFLTNYAYPIFNPSNFVSSSITNGFATTNYVNSALLAATNLNGNFVATNQYIFGTNNIVTNQYALMISNSAVIVSNTYVLLASLSNAMATASNLFQNTKQPASGWLTNLSATGAFTNIIAAGQNTTITTNFTGNTIFINATNQTFITNGFTSLVFSNPAALLYTNNLPALTNGFVDRSITNTFLTTNQAALIYYPTSNPSGFVTSAITNAFLTTNQASLLYYPTSNPSGFAATNFVIGATNGLATTNFVIGATNGLATTNFVIALVAGSTNGQFATLANVSATNYANLAITTNLILAATNQLAYTGFVASAISIYTTTNQFAFGTNQVFTNALFNIGQSNFANLVITTNLAQAATNQLANTNWVLGQIALTNTATLITATNLALAVTNGGNIVFTNNPKFYLALTNPASFVATSNGIAYMLRVSNWFSLGTKTNFLVTTNDIGLIGAGNSKVDGTYIGASSIVWTNPFFTNYTILLSGGNYYSQSNGVSLYASTNAINWTLVNGINPTPVGSFGSTWHMNGVGLVGWVYSTNLNWQITNLASSIALTLIDQFAINPTNGISAATATNIFLGLTNNSIPNFAFITNYVFNATNAFSADAGFVPTNFTGNGQVPMSTNLIGNIIWVALPTTNGLVGASITNGFAGTNFYAAGVLTNLVATNASVPSVSGNVGFIPTNAINSGGSATNAWGLSGNTVTNAVIGTLTAQPFSIIANSVTGLVINANPGDVRIVGGINNTIISANASNSIIASGINNLIQTTAAPDQFDNRGQVIVGGDSNTNQATGFGFIGTGWKNQLTSHPFETILNGYSNGVHSVTYGTIINGEFNYAGNQDGVFEDGYQTIINGCLNTNVSVMSIIMNGQNNYVQSLGRFNLIGNGATNKISNLRFSDIINGQNNAINGTGIYYQTRYSEQILNGSSNSIVGNSDYSTILNGFNNFIGDPADISGASNSVAIGSNITVTNNNSVIINDGIAISSTTSNQLTLSFLNGVRILTGGIVTVNGTNVLTGSSGASQMVFFGTNNPNGNQSANFGAIYNQFDATKTNYFIGQWINTNSSTGWQ